MADPFESLRHDAENTGSTAIDPGFRADVLAEARRRLTSSASSDSIRPRVPADTPTHTPMEPIPMLAKNPKKTRPLLLAAACVALVAAGVVAVAALTTDDDKPPATTDTTPSTTRETVPPQTQPVTPETTQPMTPSVPDTAAAGQSAADRDDALARGLLLTPSEYYPDLFPALTPLGIDWDPIQADALPACASYVESVFRPIAEHDDYTVFHREEPVALVFQYTSVLTSEEQAASIMNAMAEPAFLQCGIDYRAADAGSYCCDGEKTLPEPLGFVEPSAPPFDAVGDQLNFYTWATPWLDANGVEHGHDDRRSARSCESGGRSCTSRDLSSRLIRSRSSRQTDSTRSSSMSLTVQKPCSADRITSRRVTRTPR